MITLPRSSPGRPGRPASWVSSANVRSSARKSGMASPVSASSTAASSTPGTSWPFATICVPTSTARSAARNRSSVAAGSPARDATSASRRSTSRRGNRSIRSSSTRSVPAPIRARSTDPHAGHAAGARSRSPQWWQTSRSRPWSTSETSQRGQRHERAHVRQCSAAAAPRRFWSRIARPPRSSSPASASSSGRVNGYPPSRRRSTTSTRGSRPPIRAGSSSRRRIPCHASGRGVALP